MRIKGLRIDIIDTFILERCCVAECRHIPTFTIQEALQALRILAYLKHSGTDGSISWNPDEALSQSKVGQTKRESDKAQWKH